MKNCILRTFGFLVFIIMACQISCSHKTAGPAGPEIIDFYSTQKPYGEFSNFAAFPVFVDNEWWPTSEHYYQAQKYEQANLKKWVQQAPTPMEAALRGRDKTLPKRSDWEQIKDEAMERAVRDKFTRYPQLRELLLSTGQSRLYEHTENDCYWGDCGNRTGKNKLGLLLEKLRAEFIEANSNQSAKSPAQRK